MELAKRKEYFGSDGHLDNGLALRSILSASVVQLKEPFVKSNKDSIADIENSDSSSSADSEEAEEEIIEDFKDNEDQHDDEDFIALGTPKTKKKVEKRVLKSSTKQSAATRKRKCEFCGTLETPMWRRGPTGKGTLCNACGVKWSLKFRKRAGKKSSRINSNETGNQQHSHLSSQQQQHREKEQQPREQRHSTRKKVPSAKASVSNDSKEEQSPSFGFNCSHSNNSPPSSRKRTLMDQQHTKSNQKKRRENSIGSGEEDSSSDGFAEDHLLLGRLLNVVEHQLLEEKELDLIRTQVNDLRGEIDSIEKQRVKQMEQTSSQSLCDLLEVRRQIMQFSSPEADNSHSKIVEAGSQILSEFISNVKVQMQDIVLTLGNTANNGLGKKFDHLNNELANLQKKMDTNFSALRAKIAQDANSIDQLFSAKEASVRDGLQTFKKSSQEEFQHMNRKIDQMEEAL